jgi:hypothetical protein
LNIGYKKYFEEHPALKLVALAAALAVEIVSIASGAVVLYYAVTGFPPVHEIRVSPQRRALDSINKKQGELEKQKKKQEGQLKKQGARSYERLDSHRQPIDYYGKNHKVKLAFPGAFEKKNKAVVAYRPRSGLAGGW